MPFSWRDGHSYNQLVAGVSTCDKDTFLGMCHSKIRQKRGIKNSHAKVTQGGLYN